MALPDFLPSGALPDGRHTCSAPEFIQLFCAGPHRKSFEDAINALLVFGKNRRAKFIIFGGSFVTKKAIPKDLDCVVVFSKEDDIPDNSRNLIIDDISLDVFFASEDRPNIVSAFFELFAQARTGHRAGAVVINLEEALETGWVFQGQFDPEIFEAVRSTYTRRHVIDRNNSRKALITIHGINSFGEWNAEVAHIMSSSGWIFAPFTYGPVDVFGIASRQQRDAIVDQFRDHICEIADRYGCHVSLLAHSFGTYIAARYLLGFGGPPPVPVDTLILTGSIIHEDLDPNRFAGCAATILNEIAPNDEIVGWAAYASWNDDFIGRSGQVGFSKKADRLEQRTSQIFRHTNVIRRDVVSRLWLPILESNVGAGKQAKAHS